MPRSREQFLRDIFQGLFGIGVPTAKSKRVSTCSTRTVVLHICNGCNKA